MKAREGKGAAPGSIGTDDALSFGMTGSGMDVFAPLRTLRILRRHVRGFSMSAQGDEVREIEKYQPCSPVFEGTMLHGVLVLNVSRSFPNSSRILQLPHSVRCALVPIPKYLNTV